MYIKYFTTFSGGILAYICSILHNCDYLLVRFDRYRYGFMKKDLMFSDSTDDNSYRKTKTVQNFNIHTCLFINIQCITYTYINLCISFILLEITFS